MGISFHSIRPHRTIRYLSIDQNNTRCSRYTYLVYTLFGAYHLPITTYLGRLGWLQGVIEYAVPVRECRICQFPPLNIISAYVVLPHRFFILLLAALFIQSCYTSLQNQVSQIRIILNSSSPVRIYLIPLTISFPNPWLR